MLITAVGNLYELAAYAKQRMLNGYSNNVAYLGQYFDKAYKVDDNAQVTSQETGLLNEQGKFLPTEPGLVAITTQPDVAQGGMQGTGLVHVVKIQFDVNHDGEIDLTYAGPDNTSETRPFTFWVNNDYDRGHEVDCTPIVGGNCDWEEDDVEAYDPAARGLDPSQDFTEDSDFRTSAGVLGIPSKRDLEDYTRLWLPGLATLYAQNPNLLLELSIRNNDPVDGPAINIFPAAETDGGTRYLTNETSADAQIITGLDGYFARVSPGTNLLLNNLFLISQHTNDYFIICGARRGKGELVLQIKKGTNLLAETSAWVEFKDIKEMYERWTVGDVGSMPPLAVATNAVEDLPLGTPPFRYGLPADTNTPYILHVHGWNMERWEKDRFGETMFKRLYWQGYSGRFGVFRWPTHSGFDLISWQNPATTPNHYDQSEFTAWKSAVPLRKLLVDLNAKHPGQLYLTAHSMGNIVAGEALRTNVTLVNAYVAMEAAVQSHTYDPNAPTRTIPGAADDGTPNRYANYWQSNSPCYFNAVAGAATYVNFYNTNDYAFSPGAWQLDQNLKPASTAGYSYAAGSGKFFRALTELTFPANTYEIFALCVEARCYPLGTQPNVAGFSQLNLVSVWPTDTHPGQNYSAHVWHSAQFRSTNMKQKMFWNALLGQQGLDLR